MQSDSFRNICSVDHFVRWMPFKMDLLHTMTSELESSQPKFRNIKFLLLQRSFCHNLINSLCKKLQFSISSLNQLKFRVNFSINATRPIHTHIIQMFFVSILPHLVNYIKFCKWKMNIKIFFTRKMLKNSIKYELLNNWFYPF